MKELPVPHSCWPDPQALAGPGPMLYSTITLVSAGVVPPLQDAGDCTLNRMLSPAEKFNDSGPESKLELPPVMGTSWPTEPSPTVRIAAEQAYAPGVLTPAVTRVTVMARSGSILPAVHVLDRLPGKNVVANMRGALWSGVSPLTVSELVAALPAVNAVAVTPAAVTEAAVIPPFTSRVEVGEVVPIPTSAVAPVPDW